MRSPARRSLLYIPGTRADWGRRAPGLGADAYVLDLEDAVPQGAKHKAAETVAELLGELGDRCELLVRINGLRSPHWLRDLECVVRPGLAGVLLPKVESAGEIVAADLVLSRLEERAGMPDGAVELQPMFESGPGVVHALEILTASSRVASFWSGHTRDGDLGVSLGCGWSPGGTESLYVRSKLIVDAATAGGRQPLTGVWAAIDDLDGLRGFAEQSRLLGFTGMHVIHPSHISIVNDVFMPSTTSIEHASRVLLELAGAAVEGRGAVRVNGLMIDAPMAAQARATLESALRFGIAVDSEAQALLARQPR